MSLDANAVNIEGGDAPYHHGDLRRATLDAAIAAVREGGAAGLTMRGVARDVGVSAPALYRHFPDREALLQAVGWEALAMLGRRQKAAAKQESSPAGVLLARGRAYVQFAVDEPALFRRVFRSTSGHGALDLPGDQAGDAMRGLRSSIADVARPGTGAAENRTTALRAWALVHGLAMLILDGQVSHRAEDVDAVLAPFVKGAARTTVSVS